MPVGHVLHEPGESLQQAYFPTTSIVSILSVLGNGALTEVAVVGHEGMIGIPVLMGSESTQSRAVVNNAGYGYMLDAKLLKAEFDRAGGMMQLFLRYTQALITQMSQNAVCNRRHSLEQQVCRWLLLSLDRLPVNDILVTQAFLAGMLGVRREAVTLAAGNLQDAGLIHYRRGCITVTDRARLEKRVCECYAVVKKECDRLVPRHGDGMKAQAENRLF